MQTNILLVSLYLSTYKWQFQSVCIKSNWFKLLEQTWPVKLESCSNSRSAHKMGTTNSNDLLYYLFLLIIVIIEYLSGLQIFTENIPESKDLSSNVLFCHITVPRLVSFQKYETENSRWRSCDKRLLRIFNNRLLVAVVVSCWHFLEWKRNWQNTWSVWWRVMYCWSAISWDGTLALNVGWSD